MLKYKVLGVFNNQRGDVAIILFVFMLISAGLYQVALNRYSAMLIEGNRVRLKMAVRFYEMNILNSLLEASTYKHCASLAATQSCSLNLASFDFKNSTCANGSCRITPKGFKLSNGVVNGQIQIQGVSFIRNIQVAKKIPSEVISPDNFDCSAGGASVLLGLNSNGKPKCSVTSQCPSGQVGIGFMNNSLQPICERFPTDFVKCNLDQFVSDFSIIDNKVKYKCSDRLNPFDVFGE